MKTKFQSEICPVCQDGMMESHSDGIYEFRHARKAHKIFGQYFCVCTKCGTKGYLPGQRAANLAAIKAYQSKLPDYISPSDVLAVREKYSLTQKDANALFGGGKQGFTKWERGLAVPAGPTARLIKLALASSEALKELAQIAGVTVCLPDYESETERSTDSRVVVILSTHFESCTDFKSDLSESIPQWTPKNSNQKYNYLN